MPRHLNYKEILKTVTVDVASHPRDLSRHYVERFGVSRVTANNYLKKLEEEGWIARSGPSTHPVFSVGYKRQVDKLYKIKGLEEDLVWAKDFKPYLLFSENVGSIVNHGFTEMLNNAIDHSQGESVLVYVLQSETEISVVISDDGVGIFDKITKALSLPDKRQALFELAKGKLTTDPSKHSGEGVFFTSRMFDKFKILANGLEFNHDFKSTHDFLHDAESGFENLNGTTVLMQIELSSKRTTSDVYQQFTEAPEDYDFSKTVVPMKLALWGDEALTSRSQAKRLIARFDRFKKVILDFTDVKEIGQAFADELFRVYATNNTRVELIPTNMAPQVERMFLRAVAPR